MPPGIWYWEIPAGHSFVWRDLVLIELSGHATPSSLREGGLKISEKIFAGGDVRNFNVGGGGGAEGYVILM